MVPSHSLSRKESKPRLPVFKVSYETDPCPETRPTLQAGAALNGRAGGLAAFALSLGSWYLV